MDRTEKAKSVSKRSCHSRGAQLLGKQKEQDVGASNPFFTLGALPTLTPLQIFLSSKGITGGGNK